MRVFRNLDMEKDFDSWNTKKRFIHARVLNMYFKEREVWWCSLEVNIGFEQDGRGSEFRRPVLVLRKFSKNSSLVVPLTTKIKNNKYYVSCNLSDDLPRMAIISQIRLVDSRRFIDKLGVADIDSCNQIKSAIKEYLDRTF